MLDSRLPMGYLLVVCFIANIVASAVALSASSSWQESTKEVKQGETFSVTCVLNSIKVMDIVRLVKENEGETNNQISISDRNIVKSPFLETNRYSVSVNRKAKTVTLSFTGVRGEDSGRIGCHKLDNNQPQIAWMDLKVLVPIKEIYIASRDKNDHETRVVHEDDMVYLRENEDGGVVCSATVSGSRTPPELRVVVGEDDKTAMFKALPKSETLPNGGLPSYSSAMQLVYESLTPDASFNGKKFVCEGKMEGFDKRTVEAIFMVEYGPIVTCSREEYYVKIGSRMTLGCDVQSNPPATVSWVWGDNKQLTSGQVDEANNLAADERSMHKTQPLESSDKKRVSLVISEVTKEHLGSYTLKAKNDYGEKSVVLELSKASTAPPVKPKSEQKEQQSSSGTVPAPTTLEMPTTRAITTATTAMTTALETTEVTDEGTPDAHSVTGAGSSTEYRLWNLLVSLTLSMFIFITVT